MSAEFSIEIKELTPERFHTHYQVIGYKDTTPGEREWANKLYRIVEEVLRAVELEKAAVFTRRGGQIENRCAGGAE